MTVSRLRSAPVTQPPYGLSSNRQPPDLILTSPHDLIAVLGRPPCQPGQTTWFPVALLFRAYAIGYTQA
jgi:hypothetical protein